MIIKGGRNVEKPTKFYSMAQVFEYLDTINDPDDMRDDVIISCLCVGYLVNVEDVKAKHLIVNDIKGYEEKFGALFKEMIYEMPKE